MQQDYKECIAHIDKKTNRIQTVKEHCNNVAKYASESGKTLGLEHTMFLLGNLHDIGKFSAEFQKHINGDEARVDHSTIGGKIILDKFYKNNGSFEDKVAELLSIVIFEHHGQMDIMVDGNDYTEIERRINSSLPQINTQEALTTINLNLEEEFVEATKELEKKFNDLKIMISSLYKQLKRNGNTTISKSDLHKPNMLSYGLLVRLCLSILVDSDWRDSFEFSSNTFENRIEESKRIELWKTANSNLLSERKKFKQSKISKLRNELAEQCKNHIKFGKGIYKCSMPTGSGKTIDMAEYSVLLSEKEKYRHCYYIAPYLSIIEQNSKALKTFFGVDNNVFLEFHSNITKNRPGTDNNDFINFIPDNLFDEPFISTTLVRILEMGFSNNKQDIRRFWQLTNSVIVFDEAQNIPIKCVNLFNQLCNFLHYCCNSTVVICTATQPLFEKTSRPLLFSDNFTIIQDTEKYNKVFKRTEILDYTKIPEYTTEELSDFILNNTSSNSLVILNTKSAVRKLRDYIESQTDKYKIFELTTYMCAQHRLDIIDKIKELLKKDEKLICLSTQLIEAGVDISFKTVFRSASGIDSILQANGRCNREGENNKEESITYIINYAEENIFLLKEIHQGKQIYMERIKNLIEKNEPLDAIIEKYYNQYFFENKKAMDYKSENTTLFEKFSENKGENSPRELQKFPYFRQAFKTAGSEFKVIDDFDTVTIIVPYKNKGREIINKIKNSKTMFEIKQLLKDSQRFTVSLNRNSSLFKDLIQRNCIVKTYLSSELYILDNDFYEYSDDKNNKKDRGVIGEMQCLIM